jgi:hypothetical protein
MKNEVGKKTNHIPRKKPNGIILKKINEERKLKKMIFNLF